MWAGTFTLYHKEFPFANEIEVVLWSTLYRFRGQRKKLISATDVLAPSDHITFFLNVHVWGIIRKAPALGILSLPSCVEFPALSDIGKADPRVRGIFPFSCLLGFPIFLSASREVRSSDHALTMGKSGPYEPSQDF